MKLISVDLGAQSGRVAVGTFDGRRLAVSEVHRFPNVPVRIHDRLHWDALRLTTASSRGSRCRGAPGRELRFGGRGRLGGRLRPAGPGRTPFAEPRPLPRQAHGERLRRGPPAGPAPGHLSRTGNQLLPINTLYQLWAMVARQDPVLDVAERLLLMPDLFHYWLSGVPRCELTEATTTQCYDPVAG